MMQQASKPLHVKLSHIGSAQKLPCRVSAAVTTAQLMQLLACLTCRLGSTSLACALPVARVQLARRHSFESRSTSMGTVPGIPDIGIPRPCDTLQLSASAATKSAGHDYNKQQSMQGALQQSLHLVCTSQLQEFSRQQHAMQKVLQVMTMSMQDRDSLIQQQ